MGAIQARFKKEKKVKLMLALFQICAILFSL